MIHNIRYAWRLALKYKLLTTAVVLTLGLCIGVNTAFLSVADRLLLHPLPYPEPERLGQVVLMFEHNGAEGVEETQSAPVWEAVRDHVNALDATVFTNWTTPVNFGKLVNTVSVREQRVGFGFFRVLGVPPAIGREFTRDEDRSGGPAVVVLSHRLWRQMFNQDPSILGASVTVRGEQAVVVGIAAPNFQTSVQADIWTPLRPSATRGGAGGDYIIVGRLRSGATWSRARAEISTLTAEFIAQLRLPPNTSAKFDFLNLHQMRVREVRTPVLILWAAVAAVLLIGCVNLAGLLLARSATRYPEIATRMALGADRATIFKQLLVESVVLAMLGGVAGVGFGMLALSGIKALAQDQVPILESATLDWRILAIVAAVSLMTGIAVGFVPALQAMRLDIRSVISSRTVAGRKRVLSLSVLAAFQIAIALPLLIGAGLLLRTFVHLWNIDPGFDPSNISTAKLSLLDKRYNSSQRVNRMFEEGLRRIQEVPGVESAAVALSLPYERGLNMGYKPAANLGGRPLTTTVTYVTPQYFSTLRIPLLRGRSFAAADSSTAQKVTVVNEEFARRYLLTHEPVGQNISVGAMNLLIVGMIPSFQQRPGLDSLGPIATVPSIYIPAAQVDDKLIEVHAIFSPSWILRTSGKASLTNVQKVISSLDPLLPATSFRSIDDIKLETLSVQLFVLIVVGSLGGLALGLAIIGIYALISNSVTERTREMGIRIAIGATPASAIWSIVRRGMQCTLAGIILGSLFTMTVHPILARFIWGVRSWDPLTLGAVIALLMSIASIASIIPALRIATLNPSDTLREE